MWRMASGLWYNELMSRRLVPVMSLIAAVVLLVMLNFTTPTGIGPFGVLVFFTTFYMLTFGIALILVKIVGKMLGKNWGSREYLYGAVVAFGPIMLMLAQSLGTMSWFTVALTSLFILLGCFLISKRLA